MLLDPQPQLNVLSKARDAADRVCAYLPGRQPSEQIRALANGLC